MDWKLLHYRALQRFNEKFYEDILTKEHLTDEQKHFTKFTKVDTGETVEENVNFPCYQLEKDGTKYLFKSYYPDNHPDDGKRVDILDVLPIKVTQTVPISRRDIMYERIVNYSPVRVQPEKEMEFDELVDTLACLKHTEPKDQKLYWMLALTSLIDRVYFRLSTTPGFGKDSAVKILELLTGRATSTNADTSRAKLEYLTQYDFLALTEFADLSPEPWSNIEKFILDVGDGSPTIPKRTRSFNGVDEIIDIRDFSVILFYNDLKDYQDFDDYFDNRAKSAVSDRLPGIRFAGNIDDERLEEAENEHLESVADQNMDEYKRLIRTIKWWEDNYEDEINRDWSADFGEYPPRWRINFKRVAKSINLYADDKQEYNEYIDLLKDRVEEYDKMLMYPHVYEDATQDLDLEQQEQLDAQLDNISEYNSKLAVLQSVEDSDSAASNGSLEGF